MHISSGPASAYLLDTVEQGDGLGNEAHHPGVEHKHLNDVGEGQTDSGRAQSICDTRNPKAVSMAA